MTDETTKQTELLTARLREDHHHDATVHLARTLAHGAESGLLFAPRKTLERTCPRDPLASALG